MMQEIAIEMTKPDVFEHMLKELIDDEEAYYKGRGCNGFTQRYLQRLIDTSFLLQNEIRKVYEDLQKQMESEK